MAKLSDPAATAATPEDVRAFLQQLHEKLAFKAPLSLVFKDKRGKNLEALPRLSELGVAAAAGRQKIIAELRVTDYCGGPVENYNPLPNEGPLWVFGKYIKGEPYYVKLQMGYQNGCVICESFHPAEQALRFPFQR